MVAAAQIFTAKVMHKRLFPKENHFAYGVYYLALPLPAQPLRSIWGSFDPADLGRRDGSDPHDWARAILSDYGINEMIKNITLITMPRILGYIFNPVSFYLCMDENGALRAVLCEVHNTFGEQHSYLCAHADRSPIAADAWLAAEKIFHVSPFLDRSGSYLFRFDMRDDKLGIWIDYHDAAAERQLLTSLIGKLEPLDRSSLRRAFWRHPLVTLKAITLIHWQAMKLFFKGIRYFCLPKQHP
ncbi:MAG TPA: DUF1365 domain-containing protein, partial [Alphaproteobacteria bacterium]|nr:DUF1365 domain-containing protein [Alphaproteobacteria bacterium]